MRSLSEAIHRTPWWALVIGGIAVVALLAVFVTPFHLIEYRKEGASPEENRAFRREVDKTFAEGAMDIARGAIVTIREATKDPVRREELDRALEELDTARSDVRDAGADMLRAKRDAIDAARDVAKSIEEAHRNAKRALEKAGVENEKVTQALNKSLALAKQAEAEANRELAESADKGKDDKPDRIVIDMDFGKDGARIDMKSGEHASGKKPGVEVLQFGFGPTGPRGSITVDKDDPPLIPAPPGAPGAVEGVAPPEPPAIVVKPLPPEVRAEIRKNVSADLKKIGLGAGLILVFLPLFALTIIAKIFIDRSRAAQRMADLKKKEAEYHRMGQQVTEAKLMALQAQVEPHFLYNTLANVQALTEVDPARANTMVGHLIQYLRSALPKMRESISTVGQEVELVRAYLNILQMRMGKRLAFDISVPESLTATPFPPLMLPSLVENAIKHGLEPQREGGSVLISAQALDGRLRLIVSDTGRGFGETVGAGVGLANIRERLAALYGETAKLTLESNSPAGVIATIEVPLDGARGMQGSTPGAAGPGREAAPAQAATAKTTAGKVFSAVGSAERTWRKALSFAFVALVVVAAVVFGLALFAVMTGHAPVHIGSERLTGPGGALLGAAGVVIGFAAVVIALAAVIAIVYGLGWLFVGVAIFIPVVVLIAALPALAPVVLLILLIWWVFRKKKTPQAAPEPAPKVEPVMQAAPPPADEPPRQPPAAG